MIKERLKHLHREKAIDDFIPFSSLVAPDVVICRSGELIGTFRLEGCAFETVDDSLLDLAAQQLNTLYQTHSSSHVAVQIHRVRRKISDRLSSGKTEGFAHALSETYNEVIGQSSLMATELYFTLIHRQNAALAGIMSKRIRTKSEIFDELTQRIDLFQKDMESIRQALSAYGAVRLSSYKENTVTFSEQLSFYNFLITGNWQKIRVTNTPLYHSLGNVQVFIGTDTLQLQTTSGNVFCQAIEIKDYTQGTWSGILDSMLYTGRVSPYPFIETQTFAFLSKPDGLKALKTQQRQLMSSSDAAISQIREMTHALDAVASGEYAIGEYSYSLLVMNENQQRLEECTTHAANRLKDNGFIPFISTLALGGAYLSQLPCNFSFRPRKAKITSLNFAHLAPLHNHPKGKRNNNPWGEAVAIFRTPTEQPYYFNFHESPKLDNSYGKKLLGNTTVLGASGAGKTVVMNFLISQMQKYREKGERFTSIYFDKDRGAEIAIRSFGGGYLTVENGKATGFNPFALDATPENIQFLIQFTKLLITMDGKPLSAADESRITNAINAVMSMPKPMRRLGLLPQNMVQGEDRQEIENSVVKRLRKWVEGGDLAWVFDNPQDTLNFELYNDFGIDGTDFLDNKEIRSPVAFYLLYRMEQLLDGRRFMLVMDEFWKWLQDEAFSDFAFNKLKTIRKQNGFGVFITQSPAEILTSKIARAVIEQSATFIFLPNPQATAQDYIEGFKVTEKEFARIKTMAKDSRLLLIKQGQESALCRLDLSAFPQALKVLSGSTDNILFAEKLRSIVGNDPQAWLPYFLGEKTLDGQVFESRK